MFLVTGLLQIKIVSNCKFVPIPNFIKSYVNLYSAKKENNENKKLYLLSTLILAPVVELKNENTVSVCCVIVTPKLNCLL